MEKLTGDLAQAEKDLERLINHAQSAIPTIERALLDTSDWRKDIRQTILENLTTSITTAIKHQSERKHPH